MMHFCFLTGLYSRYNVLMFDRQGKSLVKAGYKVSLIVCDDKPNEIKNGIEIISTQFKPKNRFERFRKTRNILLKEAKKINADVYQISDPELIYLIKPLKKLNKVVIFNMREYYPSMLLNKSYIFKPLRKIAAYYCEHILKVKLKQYDAVFTITPWVVDILQKSWNIKQTFLLANFPRISRNYTLSYDEYINRGNVLCYEGTIYLSSRQEKVFKALENLPNVRYLLAGKIDENYSYIKKLPYWEKVQFIDGFRLEDLKNIFAQSTISNVFRDFGGHDGSLGVLKVFESMEAALPVLFADVPLYRSINEKWHCGICVDPNSVESIERAIRYLVEH